MDMDTIKALELILILGVIFYFFRSQKRSAGKPDDEPDRAEQRRETDAASGRDDER